MKGIIILSLVLLAGCGTYVPLEQLEANALVSGDWSAVEKREQIISRRQSHQGIQCPSDEIAYCERSVGSKRCECVEARVLTSIFSGR